MKTERLQILVDPVQRERLERTATERGVSVASLVRTAIDVVYPPQASARARAAAALLDAEPMDLPPIEGLLDELDALRGRRA
ncbi:MULTISPECIES: hypothetical protein [Bacteria]|jgi:hypothetical protein